MKKSLLTLFTVFGLLFGQATTKAQAVEQGNSTLDLYYGGVSFGKTVWLALGEEGATAKYLGVMGLKYEYMFSDKMGVGAEFNYTDMQLDWTYADTNYSVTPPTVQEYNYKLKRTVIRFMPRFNIHFGSSESFDGYFGVAAGYRNAKTVYTDDNPNNTDPSYTGLNPMALRIAVGGRYYFTSNIGLHMELGIGGGMLLHGGLSFKF